MKWLVKDNSSPFINNGNDWTLLFSTGDACDLQIQSPTLGKSRYIFTMDHGHPVVVRFRYNTGRKGWGWTIVPALPKRMCPSWRSWQ